LLKLRISRGKRDTAGDLAVQTDLEGILARARQWNVEDQHRTGLDIYDTRGRLAKLHGTLSPEKLGAGLIHEADPDGVNPDLGSAAPNPKHEVSTGVDRRKIREPDMLKHAEHTEFSLLVDESVVGDDREIEVQRSVDSDGRDHVVLFDLVHYVHAFRDLAEDRMHPIEVRLGRMTDEELAAAGVFPGMRHRKSAGHVLVGVEVGLALDLVPGSTGPHPRIARLLRERVPSLNHEVGNNAVESRAVIEFTVRQLLEVIDRPGHLGIEEICGDGALAGFDFRALGHVSILR